MDFSSFDLIIDARSPREFADDHIPRAINLPVVGDDEYAEVGTTHRSDKHRAYLVGVAYSLRNMADAVDNVISRYDHDARILVYCFRGGKRSRLWTDTLSTIGFRVQRLEGGWKRYRQFVIARLEVLPRTFSFNVLCGPTGCGKTRLLQALRKAGAQVLDLEEIASHRGSLIGALPGIRQPGQKWFESMLLDELSRLDPSRPVWVESESKKIGALQLPLSLFETMHCGRAFQVAAPMDQRVLLWREDYRHLEEDPPWLLERLQPLRPLVGGVEFALWEDLAAARRMPELFERLMTAHYDPAYARSIGRHYPQIGEAEVIALSALDELSLARCAAELAQRHRVIRSRPLVAAEVTSAQTPSTTG